MINHRNLATIALTLFALITTISAEDHSFSRKIRSKRFACPDYGNIQYCSCKYYGTLFVFDCPGFDPALVISFDAAIQEVRLNCRQQYDFDSLLHLAIGNISLLDVRSCVLNESQPILETFRFLGVNDVRGFQYDAHLNLREFQYSPKHFEGFKGLENLTLIRGGGILGNALEQLSNLKLLNIQSITLKLQRGMFDSLHNLEVLSLEYNRIDHLEDGLFKNQRKLQVLSLVRNSIQNISKEMFNGLTNLRKLDLRHNNITSLDSDCFSLLRELTDLSIGSNTISSFPEGMLFANRKLETFDLRFNKSPLDSLPKNFLANLPNLRSVNLDDSKISNLPHSLFRRSTQIVELNLAHNRLRSIPLTLLSSQRWLRDLNLAHNLLETVPDTLLLETIPNYHPFSLFYNDLQYADFHFLSNIFVDLSNNNISVISIPSYYLEFNPNKSRIEINVDLSNNPLDCSCIYLDFVKYVQDRSVKSLHFNTDRLRCAKPESLRDTLVEDVRTEYLKCMSIEGCPAMCSCDLQQKDYTIVVNCNGRGLTRITELPQPEFFEGFKSIELHLEDNRLTELPTTNLLGYNQVTRLYARNNAIRRLLPENLPSNLHFLDLSWNQLQTVDDSTIAFLKRSSTLSGIRLSKNHWQCNCEASRLLKFIQRNQNRIVDMPEVRCNGTDLPFGSITVDDLCNDDLTRVIVICLTMAIMCLTVGLLQSLFYRYQTKVKVWLFTHNLFLGLITEDELDRDKRYDAFLSYSHLDEDFVTDHLVPTLEKEPMNFKTCWHVRDFMPGEMIISQIIKSIEDSRRTVIVLSKNFLQSHWAKEEFRQAHVQSMEDNRIRVIVIIYDDIGDVEKLDSELRAYLKTNTYVKWGDPWFWDKLRYAMPHPLKIKGVKQKDILLDQKEATTPSKAELS